MSEKYTKQDLDIHHTDYGKDDIKKIKNPLLRKLYMKRGMSDTTYLISKYFTEVLGDDGWCYDKARDYDTLDEQRKHLEEDFLFYTQSENVRDFFSKETINELEKYAHFVL